MKRRNADNHDVAELRSALADAHKADKRVGLVPTMGYLHDGHLALIEASRAQCDVTVVSIFVNPIQFGPREDLSTYRRDFQRDEKLCRDAGVTIVFAPASQEIYPAQFETFVEPGELAKPLCGAFGQNDFQQCAVVRRMAIDLNLPIEIVTVPTVREADRLAMSSRNRYLSEEDRGQALAISRGLFAAAEAFGLGERNVDKLVAIAKRHLETVDQLQYLELVDGDTLKPASSPLHRPAALCVAAYVGSTRLIDNVILQPTP